MRKILGLIMVIALVLCASSVYAASFSVEMEPASDSSNKIYKDEVAEFKISIYNSGSQDDRYLIYSLDPSWRFYSDSQTISVPAKTRREFTVYADPTSVITKSGLYSVNLDVKSTVYDDIVSSSEDVSIKPEAYREFQPSVSVFANVNENGIIDSREDIDVKIRLVNRNALDIPKLTMFVESELFEDTFSVAIGPNSEIHKILTFNIDEFTEPQSGIMTVKAVYDGKIITDKRIEYEVQENKAFFGRKVSEDKSFLFTKYAVELENNGNVPSVEKFSYDISAFGNLFTETDPEAEFVSGPDGSYLEFEVELDPSESTVVHITTNYKSTFMTVVAILGVLVLVVSLYYLLRSPVLVTKKATVVAQSECGTSEIKILLNIRNRTNKILENISVVDRIPDITEIEKEFSMGTLRPTKIVRNSRKGTLIRWDFPAIEGFEERLITYRIHSKLGILGNFVLPPTIVRYDTPSGRTRAVRSKAVEK